MQQDREPPRGKFASERFLREPPRGRVSEVSDVFRGFQRSSQRPSQRFRGFQMFLEVFRGFQRSSQRPSQRQISLSGALGLVAPIPVAPQSFSKSPLLGNPWFAPWIPVVFVISVVSVISTNPTLNSLFVAV